MNFLSVLQHFEKPQIERMKIDFKEEFEKLIKYEKEVFCPRYNQEPKMTNDKIREIEVMLEKCGNGYHVEALKRLVCQEMLVPTMKDVEEKANKIMTEALHV